MVRYISAEFQLIGNSMERHLHISKQAIYKDIHCLLELFWMEVGSLNPHGEVSMILGTEVFRGGLSGQRIGAIWKVALHVSLES